MKISFVKNTDKDRGIPREPQNLERLDCIASAGDVGKISR